jgi:hypothetical protein
MVMYRDHADFRRAEVEQWITESARSQESDIFGQAAQGALTVDG